MATIVSTLFSSLDGVVEIDPTWHFPYFDTNMGAAVGDVAADVDVLLIGRVTYDSFAGAWPDREAAGGEDATFAAQLGDMRASCGRSTTTRTRSPPCARRGRARARARAGRPPPR